MPNPGRAPDPLLGFRFAIEVSGIQEAFFTECSGLQAETEVQEYKEGGVNTGSHKLPGRTTYTKITLKHGVTGSRDLIKWYQRLIMKGYAASERKNVSIVVYDSTLREAQRWNLIGAIPIKWVGPTFNPSNNDVAIESLELEFNNISSVAS